MSRYDGPVPVRDAGGYQYLSDEFKVVHTTSVPMNDEEAIDYFRIVQCMFPKDSVKVKYLTRREMNGHEYKMIPWQYDPDMKVVKQIVKSNH